MTDLVAVLSTGKGTWGHVAQLVKDSRFETIFLITNAFGKEKFTAPANAQFVVVDPQKPLQELVSDIYGGLKDKIHDTEVAFNFISGSGKEHMAVLSALLRLGLGIRLVVAAQEGVEEL